MSAAKKMDEIYKKSRRLLKSVFKPAETVHLRLGVQRLYCDEKFPTNHNNGPLIIERLHNMLTLSEKFADRTHGCIPTWDAYHDPALFVENFSRNYFVDTTEIRIEAALKRFRDQGNELCIPTFDQVFRCPRANAFEETHLEQKLKIRGTRTLLLSGVFREDAVTKTAIEAARKGFNTFIIDDLSTTQDQIGSDLAAHLQKQAQDHGFHRINARRVRLVIGSL